MSDWLRYLLTTRSLPFFHLLQLDNLDDQLGGLLTRGRPPRFSSFQNRFFCLISYGRCLLQFPAVSVQSNGLPPLFYTTLDQQCRTHVSQWRPNWLDSFFTFELCNSFIKLWNPPPARLYPFVWQAAVAKQLQFATLSDQWNGQLIKRRSVHPSYLQSMPLSLSSYSR